MARRKRTAEQQKEQHLPIWLQGAIAFWMVGVLIWFFADQKIQHWLAMMLADLFGM